VIFYFKRKWSLTTGSATKFCSSIELINISNENLTNIAHTQKKEDKKDL